MCERSRIWWFWAEMSRLRKNVWVDEVDHVQAEGYEGGGRSKTIFLLVLLYKLNFDQFIITIVNIK
jgi:hypothetical protein